MKKLCGIMLSEIAFANMPVLMKSAGLDFFILDCEHGGFDYADVSRIVMTANLCGLEVVVRLPGKERKDIVKFMDMGADGVLLPMTDTPDDIRQVVRFAKYGPLGARGISTMRAHTLYAPPSPAAYLPAANARTKVFAQMETAAGTDRIADILAVEGVDGIFVGPNDLSADYGCLNDDNAPEILRAIEKAGRAAAQARKTAGIITANPRYLRQAVACGFTRFSKGSELHAMAEYCKAVKRDITAM